VYSAHRPHTAHNSDRQSFAAADNESCVLALEFLVLYLPACFLITTAAPGVNYFVTLVLVIHVAARDTTGSAPVRSDPTIPA
jgi:hypothetical protein